MPIDVYAIVTTPLPLAEQIRRYGPPIARHTEDGDLKILDRALNYHFCHCRLVQPKKTGKAIPKPKWDIVRDIFHMSEDHWDEDLWFSHAEGEIEEDSIAIEYEWNDVFKCTDRMFRPNPWNIVFLGALRKNKDIHWMSPLSPIGDRRIQLKQIRFLFPETKTMPLAYALDYIRDKGDLS